MLAIEKKGKNYQYQYIFDAKYRIDFAETSHYKRKYGTPGPMEEDINTMHRYRDALVVEQEGLLSEQPTERTYYSRGTKRKHTRNIHFIKVSKK